MTHSITKNEQPSNGSNLNACTMDAKSLAMLLSSIKKMDSDHFGEMLQCLDFLDEHQLSSTIKEFFSGSVLQKPSISLIELN